MTKNIACLDEGRPDLDAHAAHPDYRRTDTETDGSALDEIAGSIRARMSNVQQDMLQIGRDLVRAKAILGHGNFQRWLATEFDWSGRTAQNLMNVATRLDDKYESLSHLGAETLYKLAAPSTPDYALEEISSRAAAGEKVTRKVAAEIIRNARLATPNLNEKAKIADEGVVIPVSAIEKGDEHSKEMTLQAFELLKAKLKPPARLKRFAQLLPLSDINQLIAMINRHLAEF